MGELEASIYIFLGLCCAIRNHKIDSIEEDQLKERIKLAMLLTLLVAWVVVRFSWLWYYGQI